MKFNLSRAKAHTCRMSALVAIFKLMALTSLSEILKPSIAPALFTIEGKQNFLISSCRKSSSILSQKRQSGTIPLREKHPATQFKPTGNN
ncbi:myosin-XVIIIb-like protein [Corchorus olitorius]|uniref:Myosin-XVIIIb-like protein n=1 Tax=Corchorus olitorius TaxID=93759 RepID=A0A1R3H168_9ROSI|nr:myosin-XVIIIb-like protein [Corchorus olitorius]